MIIGCPKEIKNNENRVALTPAGVLALKSHGHRVLVEESAGLGSGITDVQYQAAGAEMISGRRELFDMAELIVKVKEPLAEEYALFHEGQGLFTYLHLAPNPELTRALIASGVTAVAYETVALDDGTLPLLIPMSEVAGRMSVQIGAMLQQKSFGGRGMLLGGVPGVLPAEVVIVGGGVVGSNAARIAVGLGARTTVLDINQRRLALLDDQFGGRIQTVISNTYSLAETVERADVLIGAVLVAGARAPKTVTAGMVKSMKPGSVIVDVAIDQGGTVETIDRVTTHDHPAYEKYGVLHYSVANMPGAVPHTSTWALTGVTLPWLLMLADQGIKGALSASEPLRRGLNICRGHITCPAVAQALELPCTPAADAIAPLAS